MLGWRAGRDVERFRMYRQRTLCLVTFASTITRIMDLLSLPRRAFVQQAVAVGIRIALLVTRLVAGETLSARRPEWLSHELSHKQLPDIPESRLLIQTALRRVLLTVCLFTTQWRESACARQFGPDRDPPVNRVSLDVYVRQDSERCRQALKYVEQLARQRKKLDVVIHDIAADEMAREQLLRLLRRFTVKEPGVPVVFTMNQLHVGYSDTDQSRQRVASLLDVEVCVRSACPHCRDAKQFIRDIEPSWPSIRFVYRDIVSDPVAHDRLTRLAERHRVQAASVPVFHFANQLKVGYLGRHITGRDVETCLRTAARARSDDDENAGQPDTKRINVTHPVSVWVSHSSLFGLPFTRFDQPTLLKLLYIIRRSLRNQGYGRCSFESRRPAPSISGGPRKPRL